VLMFTVDYELFSAVMLILKHVALVMSDISGLLRLVAEVPLHEDTLYWILTLGITRDLHLSTPDIIDLVDILVRRAALLHSAGTRPFLCFYLYVMSICRFCC